MERMNLKRFAVRTFLGVVIAIAVNIIITIVLTSLCLNGSVNLCILPWVSIGGNAVGCLLGILVAKGISDLPILPLNVVIVIINSIISVLIGFAVFDGVSGQVLYHMVAGLIGGISVAFLGRGGGKHKYK